MTRIMGILNATPDSFSDGGRIDDASALHAAIVEMLNANVDAIDVGGESTRPGFTPVPADVELARVRPVIRAIRNLDDLVPISIDTSKAAVAEAALRAGATMVNDVRGLSDPGMASVVRDNDCPVVMMRDQTIEGEVVDGCRRQLAAIVAQAESAGIDRARIAVDPGLGFGECPGPDVDANLALLDGVTEYAGGLPVLIGHSRKRFVAQMAQDAGLDVDAMTAQLAARAEEAGAAWVRVHNVAAVRAALSD